MNDQNMTQYTESRLEDVKNLSAHTQLLGRAQHSVARWVTFSIVVLLSVILWMVA